VGGANRNGWVRTAGIGLLAAVSLAGTYSPSGRRAYRSAREFVTYFRSLEKSNAPEGLWQRVALSLVLASADPPEPVCAAE
jgi:hypothetical protein